jgi:predicted RNase H-like nuclease (RuvC/YqgF family)
MAASMETIELMQIEIENSERETKFASAVQSELAAAYSSSQKNMVSSELQKKQVTALQQQMNEASSTIYELNQTLHENLAASQQKLVSLAAHSELQDERIANCEQQMRNKDEELVQALAHVAALNADCAKLIQANESFLKWKQETEAWNIEAIAIMESKDSIIQGRTLSVSCHCTFHFASGLSCTYALATNAVYCRTKQQTVRSGS